LLALLALVRPARLRLAYSLLPAFSACVTMGSLEFVREAIWKPFVTDNYLYSNSLYANPLAGAVLWLVMMKRYGFFGGAPGGEGNVGGAKT
jgi:hypothetical protein